MPQNERDRLERRYGFTPDRTVASRADSTTYFGTSDTGERAVLKELELAHARTWKAVELFEREVDVLQSLEHPRIPTYRESFTREDDHGVTLAILRDYVPGETLEAQFDEVEPAPLFDDSDLESFFDEMLEILEYLHDLHPPVVHRDITPAHVVEGADGSFSLVGFGSLQSVLPRTRGGSTFVGSRGYMPVEQMMGKAEPASDLYALGMTALSMRTGLRAGELRSRDGSVAVGECTDTSAGLEQFFEELLARDPDDRPMNGRVARRRFERRDALEKRSVAEGVVSEQLPERTRTASVDSGGVQFELESPPPGRFEKALAAMTPGLLALMLMTEVSPIETVAYAVFSAAVLLEWMFSQWRNAVIRADRDGLETNNTSRYRLGFGGIEWTEIDTIAAYKNRHWRGDYYSVRADFGGDQVQIATFLTGPQAEWVAERLEMLRREYSDDERRDRPALEPAD